MFPLLKPGEHNPNIFGALTLALLINQLTSISAIGTRTWTLFVKNMCFFIELAYYKHLSNFLKFNYYFTCTFPIDCSIIIKYSLPVWLEAGLGKM